MILGITGGKLEERKWWMKMGESVGLTKGPQPHVEDKQALTRFFIRSSMLDMGAKMV